MVYRERFQRMRFSKSSACATITGGDRKMSAGDTLTVGNGTYTREQQLYYHSITLRHIFRIYNYAVRYLLGMCN